MELIDVVVKQLGDQVDVGEDHPSAAVPVQAEIVQSKSLDALLAVVFLLSLACLFFFVLLNQVNELVVLVSHHFAAGEASNWNYHVF